MKKISFFILIFSCLLLNNNFLKNFIKGEEIQATSSNTKIFFDDELPDSYQKVVFVSQDLQLLIKNKTILLYSQEIKKTILASYQSHYYQDNQLYLLTYDNNQSKLYIVNLRLYTYNEYLLTIKGFDLLVNNQGIYIVGESNQLPCIQIYDHTVNLMKEKKYPSNGLCYFSHIKSFKQTLILGGYKEAHLDSTDFQKVGNKGEYKSFLLFMNEDLSINKEYYFNENNEDEKIHQIVVGEDQIEIILQTTKQYFYYVFRQNEIVNTHLLRDSLGSLEYLPNLTSDLIYLQSSNGQTILYNYTKQKEITSITGTLKGAKVINGGLFLATNSLTTNLYGLNEYHINYLHPKIVNRLKYDLDDCHHFEVESYFEELVFTQKSIEPFHQYMMSGEYEITYEAKSQTGVMIYLTTPFIVQDYVNIIDQGVYPKGTKLMFFGRAMLNNENINNGYVLNTSGKQTLVLTNINGQQKEYNFLVVDQYYKDNDHFVIPSDYQLEQTESLEVIINLNHPIDVRAVIINNQEYYHFLVKGQQLIINIPAKNSWGYDFYQINKLIYQENDQFQELFIDQSLVVLTKKQKPQIQVDTTIKDQLYHFNLQIEDSDQALVDFFFEIDDGQNIEYWQGGLNTITYQNFPLSDDLNIKLYMAYENGSNQLLKEEVWSFKGHLTKDQTLTITSTPNVLDVLTKKVGVKVDLTKVNLKDCELLLSNQNIIKDYSSPKNNYLIIGLTIGLSVILIIVFVSYLSIKKVKRKKNAIL